MLRHLCEEKTALSPADIAQRCQQHIITCNQVGRDEADRSQPGRMSDMPQHQQQNRQNDANQQRLACIWGVFMMMGMVMVVIVLMMVRMVVMIMAAGAIFMTTTASCLLMAVMNIA